MLEQTLLIAAALANVAVGLLHVYVIAKGAPAYRQFGAGEQMATLAERGSWLPALVTWGITGTFMVFAAYYFSAAQWLPPLPWLRLGVLVVAALYTLRGLAIFPLMLTRRYLSPFEQWSSLVSLGIGVLHIAAVWAHDLTPLSHVLAD